MMRMTVISLGLAASLFASASAADECRDIEYHAFSQPVIYCPSGMLCQIVLDRDEQVHRAYSSEAGQWEPNVAVEGEQGSMRPSLVLKPETDNLMANFMVFTSRRTYHFIVKSTPMSGHAACITRFLFDDERRARVRSHTERHSAQFFPTAVASAKPLTAQAQLSLQIDAAAAATSSAGDRYGLDPQPDDYRVLRVAHSADHTYIQLVPLATTPTTVPTLMDTESGTKVVEYTYDPVLRAYAIDNVSHEYTLAIPDGKKTRSVRVQLQHTESTKRGR